jgi:hypothetical protein
MGNVNAQNEKALIDYLLGKLPPYMWDRLSGDCSTEMHFFRQHVIPRMYRRGTRDPFQEGQRHVDTLRNSASAPSEMLKAMGQIAYSVRCNLSHGRKADRGDDKDVIRHAVPILHVLCEEAIRYTRLHI